MAYKITDACISCGACEAECPVSAISEGNGKYEINADTCIECGACAGVCPVGVWLKPKKTEKHGRFSAVLFCTPAGSSSLASHGNRAIMPNHLSLSQLASSQSTPF